MDALRDEVESLEAIMMDDVRIFRNPQSDVPEVIETTVFPQVGDEAEQYVCVTLQVLPTAGYPDISPSFKLLRPRGLDDARLDAIKQACNEKLQESLGAPVVFDLIEVVREHLTDSNLPSGQCVICLYGFSDGDEFTRTECFHYLHSYCLGRHLNALRRNYQDEFDKLPGWLQKTADPFQALCPVCREPIKDEEDNLRCAMPPAELENAPDFKLTRELRELQQRMSSLFLKQKSRGAIIDVDAESGTVISIETEEEVRRRLQRKHNEAAVGGTQTVVNSNSLSDVGGSVGVSRGCDATAPESKDAACSKSDGGTSFAPVVQQNPRPAGEPTNNNYQHHNRRHYRGGRRHQQHHHHHRHRGERDFGGENHNNHGGNGGGNSSQASNGAGVSTSHSTGGKQAKAQMANSVHGR